MNIDAALAANAGERLGLAEMPTPAPAARDFLRDAHAHCKHIGLADSAAALATACGVAQAADTGIDALGDAGAVAAFLQGCQGPRVWERETMIAS